MKLFDGNGNIASENKFYMMCHQGLRSGGGHSYYANTLGAYSLACKTGYDYINIAQVKYNADHDFFCIHDDTVDASTDGTGNVADLTTEYLDSLTVKSGEDTKLAHLEDVMATCKGYGTKIFFRLGNLPGSYSTSDEKDIWNKFVALVEKYDMQNDSIFSQGVAGSLNVIRALRPTWAESLFTSSSRNDPTTALSKAKQQVAANKGVKFYYHGYSSGMSKELVDYCHSNDVGVVAIADSGTVTEVRNMIKLGCDMYQCDGISGWYE